MDSILIHNAASTAQDGLVLNVANKVDTITIQLEVSVANTVRQINFKGRVKGATGYDDIMGVDRSDLTALDIKMTAIGVWDIPVSGYEDVYFPMTLTGGTVTLRGTYQFKNGGVY